MAKTRLCQKFMNTGTCPYGDKCTFAHGWVTSWCILCVSMSSLVWLGWCWSVVQVSCLLVGVVWKVCYVECMAIQTDVYTSSPCIILSYTSNFDVKFILLCVFLFEFVASCLLIVIRIVLWTLVGDPLLSQLGHMHEGTDAMVREMAASGQPIISFLHRHHELRSGGHGGAGGGAGPRSMPPSGGASLQPTASLEHSLPARAENIANSDLGGDAAAGGLKRLRSEDEGHVDEGLKRSHVEEEQVPEPECHLCAQLVAVGKQKVGFRAAAGSAAWVC